MKPNEWLKGMENEAKSVEDAKWVRETQQTLRRERLKQVGLTALATLLIFQLTTLIPVGLYLAGILSGTVYSVVSNTQEFILITGLAICLGRRRLPLWPMPLVGWLAARFIVCWPGIALGWMTWTEHLAPLSQSFFWWETLFRLPLPLLYVVALYLVGQRWPHRRLKT